MPVRYAAQIREFDCGPTALLNLLKWLGVRATIKSHHAWLSRRCNTIDGFGTSEFDLHSVLTQLRKKRFKFTYRKRPAYTSVMKHLEKGGSIILVHPNETGLHVSFLPGLEDGIPIGINSFYDKTKSKITKKTLRRWLSTPNCIAWMITKVHT